MTGAEMYAAAYVLIAIPAALWGLWKASQIPPTNTYEDD